MKIDKNTYDIRVEKLLMSVIGSDLIALLDTPNVTEIMYNPDGSLLIIKKGNIKTKAAFKLSYERATSIVKLLTYFDNNKHDTNSSHLSMMLPIFNARLEAWLPPVVNNVCFAIRKYIKNGIYLKDYVENKALSEHTANYILTSLANKQNIIICGGTGSGKTTFANCLLNEISCFNERILILEDVKELDYIGSDSVSLTTTQTVSMRDLVKSSLRLHPDRIIIGEVRDYSAYDLLKAWNTGHPGGICTIHSNDAPSALTRLEHLIAEISNKEHGKFISEVIDIVVFIKKSDSGRHVISEIIELKDYENNQYIYSHHTLS